MEMMTVREGESWNDAFKRWQGTRRHHPYLRDFKQIYNLAESRIASLESDRKPDFPGSDMSEVVEHLQQVKHHAREAARALRKEVHTKK